MSRIKMIGMDLDGTLLNSRKELTAFSREVLDRAIQKGVVALVATGRPLAGVPRELLDFPGMRYVLTANGARIIDHENDDRILYENLLSYEESKGILHLLGEYDTVRELFFDGKGYIGKRDYERISEFVPSGPMAEYICRTRAVVEDIDQLMEESRGRSLDKVQAIFRDRREQKEARQRILALGAYSITSAMGSNLEINAPGVTKANGLKKLGEILGILPEEIMACGDGSNDTEMIRMAGLGVAMGNAIEEVKAGADYITVTNDEDGVAKAIEKFVL